MKLKINKKVHGFYFKQPFTGKIIELEENIRFDHQNNCIRVKIELENGIKVYPGCVIRDCIHMVLDADALEMDCNKITKQ